MEPRIPVKYPRDHTLLRKVQGVCDDINSRASADRVVNVKVKVHTLDIAPLRIVNHHRRSAQVCNAIPEMQCNNELHSGMVQRARRVMELLGTWCPVEASHRMINCL